RRVAKTSFDFFLFSVSMFCFSKRRDNRGTYEWLGSTRPRDDPVIRALITAAALSRGVLTGRAHPWKMAIFSTHADLPRADCRRRRARLHRARRSICWVRVHRLARRGSDAEGLVLRDRPRWCRRWTRWFSRRTGGAARTRGK